MSKMLFLYLICSNSLIRVLKPFANLSIKQIRQDVFQIKSLLQYSLKLCTRICCPTKVLFWSHVIHSPQLQQKLTISLQCSVTWGCIREAEKKYFLIIAIVAEEKLDRHYIPKTYEKLLRAFFPGWITFFPHNSLDCNLVILQPLFNASIPVTSFISICLTNCRPQPDTVF